MSRAVIQKLAALQTGAANPRAEWVQTQRAVLLAQIKNTLPVDRQDSPSFTERLWNGLAIFLPKSLVYNVVRPVAVVAMVAVLATSSLKGAAKASESALPGEILYPAKRAGEGLELAVVKVTGLVSDNQDNEAQLHAKFAKNRALEIKTIAASDTIDNKEKIIPKAVSDLNNELQTITNQLDNLKQSPEKNPLSSDSVKDVQQNTLEVKELLHNAEMEVSLKTGTQEVQDLSTQIRGAKDSADAAAFKVVEVAVNNQQNLSADAVKQVVATAIQSAVDDAAKSKESAQGVQNIVDAVKDAIKTEVGKPSAQTTPSSTAALKQLNTVAAQTKEATFQIEQKSANAEQKINEAQVFAESGNLSEALNKIREAKIQNKEATQLLDTALQTVLPVVKVKDDAVGVVSTTKDLLVIVTSSAALGLNGTSTIGTILPNATVLPINSSTSAVVNKDETKK